MDEKNTQLEKKENEPQELVQADSLMATTDPEKVVAFGARAAKALTGIIENKKHKVVINGKQYLEFGDWQTIARFFNCTVFVSWTKELDEDKEKDRSFGYSARAVVLDVTGRELTAAESDCTRREKMWSSRESFQIKSMAQTRACAKALRNVFGWVVVLAGYQETPAEEMDGIEKDKTNGNGIKKEVADPATAGQLVMIKQLAEKYKIENVQQATGIIVEDPKKLTKAQAQGIIDALINYGK